MKFASNGDKNIHVVICFTGIVCILYIVHRYCQCTNLLFKKYLVVAYLS